MMFTKSFVAAALLAFATATWGAEVQFYTTRSCSGGASEDYQGVACNTCVDPPGDWYAVQVTGIGDTRWTAHNENGCTSASQVGQFYGDTCSVAGHTAIRSAYVAC